MAFIYKILILSLLVTLAMTQSSTRSSTKSKTSSSVKAATSADEQGRTLGLFGPLLRLGLGGLGGGLRRTGLGTQADPAYGGYGGYYGGYPSSNSVYGNYGNYQNYGGSSGYRPPAYNNAYNTGYQQQQNYGLSGLSSFGTANSQGGAYTPTAGVGASQGGNSAQQAQLAALLGQALGSSLRPLLNGGSGRFGTAAATATAAAPGRFGASANPLVGLFGLFG